MGEALNLSQEVVHGSQSQGSDLEELWYLCPDYFPPPGSKCDLFWRFGLKSQTLEKKPRKQKNYGGSPSCSNLVPWDPTNHRAALRVCQPMAAWFSNISYLKSETIHNGSRGTHFAKFLISNFLKGLTYSALVLNSNHEFDGFELLHLTCSQYTNKKHKKADKQVIHKEYICHFSTVPTEPPSKWSPLTGQWKSIPLKDGLGGSSNDEMNVFRWGIRYSSNGPLLYFSKLPPTQSHCV